MLFVRNLTLEFTVPMLRDYFEAHGPINLVRKIEGKNYAFIYFKHRDHAIRAMETLNGRSFHGTTLQIYLAKPYSNNKF